jgi:hypothetical protein
MTDATNIIKHSFDDDQGAPFFTLSSLLLT